MSNRWIVTLVGSGLVLVVGWALLSGSEGRAGATPVSQSEQASRTGADAEATVVEVAHGLEQRSQPEPSDSPEEGMEESAPEPSRDGSAELAAELQDLTQSFLSDAPDLEAFDSALSHLAQVARVHEASLETDPVSGRVTGELDLGPELPRAQFTLDGDATRIELSGPLQDAERPGMLLRTVTLGFTADSAGLSSTLAVLQFHPDTRKSASSMLEPGVEAFVGWNAFGDAHGARVVPIAMRAAEDGAAWEIGAAHTLAPYAQPWAVGERACAALQAKLRAIGR